MTNTEQTIPPRTPRNMLKRALAWAKANKDYSIPIGTFLLGVALGWFFL